MSTLEARICERGNGFCDVGDYVSGSDGELYRVVQMESYIHTSGPGGPHYVYGKVELADWDDITDDEADSILCSAMVEDPDLERELEEEDERREWEDEQRGARRNPRDAAKTSRPWLPRREIGRFTFRPISSNDWIVSLGPDRIGWVQRLGRGRYLCRRAPFSDDGPQTLVRTPHAAAEWFAAHDLR